MWAERTISGSCEVTTHVLYISDNFQEHRCYEYTKYFIPRFTQHKLSLLSVSWHYKRLKLMSGKIRDIGIARFLRLHTQFFLRPQRVSYTDRRVSHLQIRDEISKNYACLHVKRLISLFDLNKMTTCRKLPVKNSKRKFQENPSSDIRAAPRGHTYGQESEESNVTR